MARCDRGSAAVEMVLLTPALVMMLLLVVHVGRAGEGMNELHHAADQGARAASFVAPARMQTAALQAVIADLASSGLSCENPVVTAQYVTASASSSVTVVATCGASRSGLALLGANAITLRATSTEVIDRFRG